MLDMAIKTFGMKDYVDEYYKYIQYYELLVYSYIEQAIANYIKPIVVNYHNQYSSLKETEEIFYEMTESVIRTDCKARFYSTSLFNNKNNRNHY
jgi:hypothetical protein